MTSNEALRELRLMNCDRRKLAHEMFELIYGETESFEEENAGIDLVYLMAAIVSSVRPTDYVVWTSEIYLDGLPWILGVLRNHCPPNHAVWEFILLDP